MWKKIGRIFMFVLNIILILFLFFSINKEKTLNMVNNEILQEKLINSINSISESVLQVVAQNNDESASKYKIWTAVVVSKEWYVITNKHVVENQDIQYSLVDVDWNDFPVKKILRDDNLDLAILNVDFGNNIKKDSDFISLYDSVNIGEFVFAIWTPLLEFPNTVSFGIISAKWRKLEKNNQHQISYYQTDLAINYGNSWWPAVNLDWKVIGLISAISREWNNIWFILPLNDKIIKKLIDDIKDKNSISQNHLWISYNENSKWAIVDSVFINSPAHWILFPGDIILAIDQNDVSINNSLLYHLYSYKAWDNLIFKISRNNQILTFSITL